MGGRKPGTVNKDTQNYLDFQLWFKQIKQDLEFLEPEKRIEISIRVVDKLFSKVQVLPSTPQESAENAQIRQEMIDALEQGKIGDTTTA